MCGRYYIAPEDDDDIMQIITALNRKNTAKTSGEIAPTDIVPVIANNRRMEPSAFAMKWGYSLPDGHLIINARSETACEKQLFRDSMARRRCLIPASCYFEWEKRENKRVKYAIRAASESVTWLAGIYRFENETPVFAILTRLPADSIAFIHNRMPVIIPKRCIGDWLNPGMPVSGLLGNADTHVVFEPV